MDYCVKCEACHEPNECIDFRRLEILKADADMILDVPRVLFEQICTMEPEIIDAIYDNAENIADSKSNIVYLFRDNGIIVGILWLTINVISCHVFVYLCSILPQYQSSNGEFERWLGRFIFSLEDIPEKYRQKIRWGTTRPEIFERFGIKRVNSILEVTKEEFDKGYHR